MVVYSLQVGDNGGGGSKVEVGGFSIFCGRMEVECCGMV